MEIVLNAAGLVVRVTVVVLAITWAMLVLRWASFDLAVADCVSTATWVRFPQDVLDSQHKRGRMHAGAQEFADAWFQLGLEGVDRSNHAQADTALWPWSVH